MATVVDHPAVVVGSLTKSPDRINTQVSQVAAQLVEILSRQLFMLLGIRTASHGGFVCGDQFRDNQRGGDAGAPHNLLLYIKASLHCSQPCDLWRGADVGDLHGTL